MSKVATCHVCPHRCQRNDGQRGFCLSRIADDGVMRPLYYGKIISLALDPIEKKPFYHFLPGSAILSVGSLGCSMNCAFCQNHQIARPSDLSSIEKMLEDRSPESLVKTAAQLRSNGNIGIAFTYNEPLINVEYVIDTFILAKEAELKTALVTNGQVTDEWLERLLPLVDAWNIDLKCFHHEGYRRLQGDFETTKNTIVKASRLSHVEVTTLIVPGLSDSETDMENEASWLASLRPDIPLHLSRFFPMHRMKDEGLTPKALLYGLQAIAKKHLRHVYLGNV